MIPLFSIMGFKISLEVYMPYISVPGFPPHLRKNFFGDSELREVSGKLFVNQTND